MRDEHVESGLNDVGGIVALLYRRDFKRLQHNKAGFNSVVVTFQKIDQNEPFCARARDRVRCLCILL